MFVNIIMTRKFIGRYGTLMHALASDVVSKIPRSERITDADPERCYYCKEFLTKHTRTMDHVMRLVSNSSINPLTDLSPVTVPCCRTCNSRQVGQKVSPIFKDEDVRVRYKLDCEAELESDLAELKSIMHRIMERIEKSSLVIMDKSVELDKSTDLDGEPQSLCVDARGC